MNHNFQFKALPEPLLWEGRYNRIPGKEPTFRAKGDGSAHAYWSPWGSDVWLTSPFVPVPGVRQMVKAINETKERHAGAPGGAFQINEFGQVLCPIAGTTNRYWVGTVSGVPAFVDPREEGQSFELQVPKSTQAGTPWKRPYIGMKFNLDANESIYFQEEDGDTRHKIRLPKPDASLLRRLQEVRGQGRSIRFIVNLHGVAVTKIEPDWEPVFVGHIDLAKWFPKQP